LQRGQGKGKPMKLGRLGGKKDRPRDFKGETRVGYKGGLMREGGKA